MDFNATVNFFLIMIKNLQILLAFCIISTRLVSQEIVSLSQTPSCSNQSIGNIIVDIDESQLDPEWNLPFELELKSINTGEVNTIELISFSSTISNLNVGKYQVSVDLSDQCDYTQTIEIDQVIQIEIDNITPACSSDGSINITVQGGAAPYTYLWSNGQSNQNIDQLEDGIYTLTVTDVTGCERIESFTVGLLIPGFTEMIGFNCNNDDALGTYLVITENPSTVVWTPNINAFSVTNPGSGSVHGVLGGLENGNYCYQITDDITGCTKEDCIEIVTSSALYLDNTVVNDENPCSKGEIFSDIINNNVIINTPSGEVNIINYEIEWDDIEEQKFSGYLERLNLDAGAYSVTVSGFCESIEETFNIEMDCTGCESFNEVQYEIHQSCSQNSYEGKINLLSHQDLFLDFPWIKQPLYIFSWSGDYPGITNNLGRTYENLRPGNYSVTISHLFYPTCSITKNFTVDIERPLTLTNVEIIPSCSNNGSGEIIFDLIGGSQSNSGQIFNSFRWIDNPFADLNRTHVYPGDYTLLVSTNCYEDVMFNFTVPEIVLTVEEYPTLANCDNNGIHLEISGGKYPYQIEWSNGSQGADLNNLEYGQYSYTVTDSGGCEQSGTIDLVPIQDVQITNSCPNLTDGMAEIWILNLNSYPTTVYLQYGSTHWEYWQYGFPLTINNTSSLVYLRIPDLVGNATYEIEIVQNINGVDCSYTYQFQVGEDDYETTFSHTIQDENDIYHCVYDIECKDLYVDEGLIEVASIEIDEDCDRSGGASPFGGLDCGSVDIKCEEQLIESRNVESISMTLLEYNAFLETFSGGGSFLNIDDLCRTIHTCPQDPTCFAHGWGGNIFQGDVADLYVDPVTGCTVLKCRRFSIIPDKVYIICGLDFLPDDWEKYIVNDDRFNVSINITSGNNEEEAEEEFKSCDPISVNIKQLNLRFKIHQKFACMS